MSTRPQVTLHMIKTVSRTLHWNRLSENLSHWNSAANTQTTTRYCCLHGLPWWSWSHRDLPCEGAPPRPGIWSQSGARSRARLVHKPFGSPPRSNLHHDYRVLDLWWAAEEAAVRPDILPTYKYASKRCNSVLQVCPNDKTRHVFQEVEHGRGPQSDFHAYRYGFDIDKMEKE